MIAWLILIAYVTGYVAAVPKLYRTIERESGMPDDTRVDDIMAMACALLAALFWPLLGAAAILTFYVRKEVDR